jgi:lipopolysaccharide/colanic/teichoic acid biosynthesis glycosyltransferase
MMPRILELSIAALGLVCLAPLFLIIAIVIKVSDRGSVFYRGLRVGRNGCEFRLLKFRTMRRNADRQGSGVTTANDSRVTQVGSILRRLKLDELPQLVNVLVGEMSLVGPRPEDPRYVSLYSAAQRAVLAYRPGITSPASIQYRDESALLAGPDWEKKYREEILPHKLAIELEYLPRKTTRSDLRVVFQTIGVIGH